MHPELFDIPFVHLTVKSYGTMMVIAFLAAVTLIRRLSRSFTPDPQYITNASLYSLIAGVVGARLFYVIHYFAQFQGRLLSVFAIWQGGLEFLGGILSAIAVIGFYCWYHKLPVRRYLDILAIGLMLALVFGRIGCFLNGCCFGKPTNLPWGVRFPYGSYAYYSQAKPNFTRNRPRPQLQLPDEYYIYDERSFSIDLKFQSELDNQIISRDLRSKFRNNRVPLSQYAKVSTEQKGVRWLITNETDKFTIKRYDSKLEVYAKIQYLKPFEDLTIEQKYMVDKGPYRCLPVHPTQLYSSFKGAVLALILYLFWRRSERGKNSKDLRKLFTKPGCTFGLMFIIYGISRFFMEFLRDDNPFEFDGLTISQNIGIAMVIFGVILIVIFEKMKTQQPQSNANVKTQKSKIQRVQRA